MVATQSVIRRAVVFAVLFACHPGSASAQAKELTPEMSLRLMVEVHSVQLDGRGHPERPLPSAGTVLGERNDTLYVVTSHHHVENAASVGVRVTPQGPLLPASLRSEHPSLDLAVLAVTGHGSDASWRLPSRIRRVSPGVRPGEAVFAIGCPDGVCWAPPERAQLSGHRDSIVQFRSYFIKPGLSGGPLVDADGAMMGIIFVRHDVAEGTAIWWPVVQSTFRAEGFPVELPVEHGFRVGEGSIRLFTALFPAPGLDVDGDRIPPGWRFEFSRRVAPRIDIVGGMTMVSFSAAPLDPDADHRESFVHPYVYAGVRHGIGALSVGGDALVPVWTETFVVGMADSDSVDLATGEYVPVRSTVRAAVGSSVALRITYRIALSERIALVAASSAFLFNSTYPMRWPERGLLELGAEYRAK